MDFEVTKKAIREYYSDILKVNYCATRSLLRYKFPFAYSMGAYGRACNYYNINEVIICAGYNPIGRKIDDNLIRKYEKKAGKIVADLEHSWGQKERKVDRLLKKLVAEALQGGAGKM